MTEIPLVDLRRMNAPLKEGILPDLAVLIDSGELVNGPAVARFEREFAAYCRRRWCVGVGSGLDALRLALIASGLEPGDQVVVPAHTFVATVEAVTQAGGAPVLCDVAETDYNLDPAAAAAVVTAGTKFLLPVHLYGQLADMAKLDAVAARGGIGIVEDACQAHGAVRDGRRAGESGIAGCFSFYPAKNLGAFGDAGACVIDDDDLADRLRALREHGQREKGKHDLEGYTARLDTMQAVILLHKLPHLPEWNLDRRRAAQFYSQALSGVGDLRLPSVIPGSEPVWHLYVVRTARPERLAHFLRERGIASGRHYPQPIHLTTAFAHLGYQAGDFPIAEAVAAEAVSLPIFPGISEDELVAVVGAVEDYFDQRDVADAYSSR